MTKLELTYTYYIHTTDSHDWYGPFWSTPRWTAWMHAHEFAAHRKLTSYQVTRNPPPSHATILPLTCAL